MTIDEARKLIQSPIWAQVRDHFLATGAFEVFPQGDLRRLAYLDEKTQSAIAAWRTALEHAEEWRKVVDGAKVRELKAQYPGAYPEVFRYQAYFTRFAGKIDDEVRRIVDQAYDQCEQILREHDDRLEAVAGYLLAHSTMTRSQFIACMQGEAIPEAESESIFDRFSELEKQEAQKAEAPANDDTAPEDGESV